MSWIQDVLGGIIRRLDDRTTTTTFDVGRRSADPGLIPLLGAPCPNCSWDEAIEGEPVRRPCRESSGRVVSRVCGYGFVCLNCGMPFVVSETHGAYRPNRKAREEAEATEKIKRATYDGTRKPIERMPKGMEDMKPRPRE